MWIEHRRDEPIPQEFFYDGYQTDRDNDDYTPLLQWIECRPGEPIPKELYYDGYKTDRDRWDR